MLVKNFNPKHLALTDSQYEVLMECLTKLNENGIGLGHDYENMGTLFAYNKNLMRKNGYEVRTFGVGKDWEKFQVPDDETTRGILENVTYLEHKEDSPFKDAEYLFLSRDVLYIYPKEYIEKQ